MKASDSGKINKISILREVWRSPGISRSDLARELGLNKSTITRGVNELLDLGILEVQAQGDPGPQGGRRPVFLDLSSQYGMIIGLGFQEDCCEGVALDLRGRILAQTSIEGPVTTGTIDDTIEQAIEQLKGKVKKDIKVLGVGIGVPGVVSPGENRILQSAPLLVDEPFELSEIEAPLYTLENDARCCCWGELVNSPKQMKRNFLFVQGYYHKNNLNHSGLGFSVGMGIVLNSQVQRGSFGSSGEFRSILSTNSEGSQFSHPHADLALSKEDEEIYLSIMRELATNVSLLANTMDMGQVILGGESLSKPHVKEIFQEAIDRFNNYPQISTREVENSVIKENTVAYGAAAMILNKLYTLPVMDGEDNMEECPNEVWIF